MSDSVRPHRRQPTRLPRPWDSPGKNTGVGCHFLLQCVKVKNESEVTQLCPTPSDPMDCSLPGSSVRGISQARVREWGDLLSYDFINSLVCPRNTYVLDSFEYVFLHTTSISLENRGNFNFSFQYLLSIVFIHSLGLLA